MDFYTHYSREYNQRYYCCEADRIPVSLIMANCNYLKKTNDTLGHEYGDLLLQRVADIITECISEECVSMRIGGDECRKDIR